MAENLAGTAPGAEVGGPDRSTEEGGAVVNGRYIPPGVDFGGLQAMVPADWEQAAKEIYGGYYSIIEKYPDLKKLLLEAVTFKYSQEKFAYELRQTTWWKETTTSAREWDIQAGLDPATARSRIEDQAQVIRDAALTAGVRFTESQLANLAENSLRWAWTTQDLNNAISVELQKTGSNALAQGFWGQSVRAASNRFGVRLSEDQINDWSSRLFTGRDNSQSFNDYLTNTAKVLYPTLASGFDRGLSFSDLTDPYAQLASRILEIPAMQVDFADPKWAQAFTMKNAAGEQVPMSFGEWADYLRTTPSFGYQFTDDARSKAYNVVDQLARAFGAA